MANIIFNGEDLYAAYGLVTPGVSGVHDLSAGVVSRQFIPGTSLPSDTLTRRDLVAMPFDCSIEGTSHSDLVTKLRGLKKAISPELGWCSLAIEDLSGLRTFARSEGLTIRFEQIPFLDTIALFPLTFVRYPHWEDLTATTATDPASINNTGDLATWPTYTCTATDTLAGGLTFTVNGKTFEYTGALVATDVLVIDAEAMTCTLNGTEDMANVADDTDWPELVTGANAVSKSSASYTLAVEYRKRYE